MEGGKKRKLDQKCICPHDERDQRSSETVRTCGAESGPGGSQAGGPRGLCPWRAEAGGKTMSKLSQAHWCQPVKILL